MSGDILNVAPFDPFADATGKDEGTSSQSLIHIRLQQRNGRKTLTTVQGISSDYDLKKIVREFKKTFQCNGTIIEHPEYGEVIQLQGDKRTKVHEWLIDTQIAKADFIKVHGF